MPIDVAAARNKVARNPLFADLPAKAISNAVDNLEVLEFAAGARVLVEGELRSDDRSSDLYFLIEGELVATRSLPGGRTEHLSSIAPGEFFGELALADEGSRSATVTAATAAVVGRLPGSVANALIADAPVVARTIAAMLARRLRAADDARISARLMAERLSLIGMAAAMLVHDLRNPLGVVKNASLLIEEGVGDPARSAARIRHASEFMLDLVQDLLDYAKGNRHHVLEPLRVSDIAEDVELFGLAPLEARGKVTVRRSLGSDATLLGDRKALSRAILNIIKNAGDAMPDGGLLTFATAIDADMATLTVADTGPGIPAKVLPTLFEPFSSYGKAGGTGLGMAMTKATIEEHGGEITVDTHAGTGTTFTVRLLLARRPAKI